MTWRRWCGAAALAALALPVVAQDRPGPGPGGRPAGRGAHEVFKMIDAYLLANVQEALGLNDEQNEKVLPLVLRLQSDRRNFHRRQGKILGELKKTLGSGSATEAQVAEGMKEFRALEAEEQETIRKHTETIDKELTVVQQAKLRILEREVERKIQALIADQRMKGRGARERPDRPDRPERNGPDTSAPRP